MLCRTRTLKSIQNPRKTNFSLSFLYSVLSLQFYEHVVLRNLRPLLPAGMPADYSLLMQHCWASDPASRPNVDRWVFVVG
jgi:hypothetical protein